MREVSGLPGYMSGMSEIDDFKPLVWGGRREPKIAPTQMLNLIAFVLDQASLQFHMPVKLRTLRHLRRSIAFAGALRN